MKLQPGDYVSTEGMTEDEYHAVCRAFIEAGCPVEEPISWKDASMYKFLGWGRPIREVTKDQILGAQKMTKVTVFGQEEAKKEEKKPIEFTDFIVIGTPQAAHKSPLDYDNVCLLGKFTEFTEFTDVMMAWNDDLDRKDIYLGHWNDGVV